MPKLFICGSNFQLEDQEDEILSPMSSSAGSSPSSTPRRTRKSGFCKSHNNKDKNPYSNRGLDKFSALLADLEEKRQKIYAQTGSQDIDFVRFVFKDSHDLVPIVVKLKDNNNNNNKKKEKKTKRSATFNYGEAKEIKQAMNNTSDSQDKFPIETSVASTEVEKVPKSESNKKKKTTKRSFSWNKNLDMWKRPSFYLPVVVILILLLLMVSGRSAAILCTSITWYVVPALKDSSRSKTRLSMKNKDYVKELSDRRIVTEGLVSSPRISHTGESKDKSSAKHGHQKSW